MVKINKILLKPKKISLIAGLKATIRYSA